MAGKFLSSFFGISDEQPTNDYPASPSPSSAATPARVAKSNKVVPIQGHQLGREPGKIAIFEPRIYSDVKGIAQQLLNGEAVIVNFAQQEPKVALKTIDFLNGVVFAIDGQMKRIGEQIFLCTPKNYEVSGQTNDFQRDSRL